MQPRSDCAKRSGSAEAILSPSNELSSQRFALLFALMLGAMASQALGFARLLGGVPTAAIGLGVIAVTLWILWPQRRLFWLASVLALPTASQLAVTPDTAKLAGSGLHAPFFCVAAAALTIRVMRSERADRDTVIGSICAYLFIALAFAAVFTFVTTTSPGAFWERSPTGGNLFDRFSYFSLVAITTLGYGDVLPVSPLARALVSLETAVGVLFPSVVIARIVSLYTSGGGRPFAPREPGQRLGRFELLLAAEVVILFATPAFEERPRTGIALSLLTTALLLAALQAGSERRITRAAGIGLALAAVITHWWPGGGPGLREASLGFEAALLALVSASLFNWLLREQRVTRELLLAATALYLLLGYVWAAAFALVGLYAPGALLTDGGDLTRSDYVYFSFVTLTTTGFGEIVPLGPVAQRLAAVESLVGVLYPSVLVARLVALYRSE